MKDLLIKIVVFSILLNISVALMHEVIPGFDDPSLSMGMGDGQMAEAETGLAELRGDLSPEADVIDNTDLLDRVLDSIGLGIFTKTLRFIDKWMFEFVNVLQMLFGGYLSEAVNVIIFGGLKTLITILYISTAIWLFTGKDIGEKY